MVGRNGRNPKSPAFQFYPGDFFTDPKVQAMSTTEIGAYLILLSNEWLDGPLPDDHSFLARMCRMTVEEFERAWSALSRCFQVVEGRLRNPRLERERTFQAEGRSRRLAASVAANEAKRTESEPNRSPTGAGSEPIDPLTLSPTPVARIPTPDTRDPKPVLDPPASPGADKPRRERKPASGPLAGVIRHWQAEWVRTRPTEYVVEAKDGVAVAAMLKMPGVTPEEVQTRATRLLESADAWMAQNASLPLLRSRWNQLGIQIVNGRQSTGIGVIAAMMARSNP